MITQSHFPPPFNMCWASMPLHLPFCLSDRGQPLLLPWPCPLPPPPHALICLTHPSRCWLKSTFAFPTHPCCSLSPDSWLSCFCAEALLSVYLAFYVVSKLGLVPSCICKIFALKRQQHVYFWYFQCWPEDAGRLETFDGVVGEEACRYGPHYFIIAGSMQGLWGWQGRLSCALYIIAIIFN